MRIETERLILRELEQQDIEPLQRFQLDPRYEPYYSWTDRLPEETAQFIASFILAQSMRPRQKYQLAVVLKIGQQLIGNAGLRMDDSLRKSASLGYELDPDYWNMGYATEAATALLQTGFEQLGLEYISAECVAENVTSERVMQKCGMLKEAQIFEARLIKGRWWDRVIYGITREKFDALIAGRLTFCRLLSE